LLRDLANGLKGTTMADPGVVTIPAWTGIDVSDADASAWYKCTIGVFVLPGIATCEGFSQKQDVDAKKSKGKDGATLEDNGRVLAQGKVQVEITARQWPTMHEIIVSLNPQKPGAIRQPRAIIHPIPNALGVHEIYVREITIGTPTAAAGMVVTFDCIEWTPQPKPVRVKKQVESPTAIHFEDGPDGVQALRAWELAQASNNAINDTVGGLSSGSIDEGNRSGVQFSQPQKLSKWEESAFEENT
jgi:hypothetical protein